MQEEWIAGWLTFAVFAGLAAWVPCLEGISILLRRAADASDRQAMRFGWAGGVAEARSAARQVTLPD